MDLILITGGARAGKSTFAERLAVELAGDDVCYVATAEPLDDDMAGRIAAHRAERPRGWHTVEATSRVADALTGEAARRVVLIDCLTMLVSNLLLADGDAAFTKAAGLELDLSGKGLGLRNQRFSMLVEDGVVKALNIDPAGSYDKTSADSLLAAM